ncbi:hypothetical protein IMCC26134_14365 [Verrucomicrobia bacterium IMCC26134]|jgi:phosphoglycolate phosphatase-like HAD superfamily hydrolase|nr:hypothetical protein IMCC26134_14365 [Verrucomicrobia bacterium IMCC26134]
MHPGDTPRFEAKHSFFIGIDSDGTAFDSMEIKQKSVFLPVAVQLWNLHAVQKPFYEIAEFINLYSVHRGVNRFQALAMALERLARHPDVIAQRVDLPDYFALKTFVLSGRALSAGSLADYNKALGSPFLSQVVEWSKRSDERYAQVTRDEGNPPYPLVREALSRAAENADIMIVSSSSHEALIQDWGDTHLLPFITLVAGQEMGNKAAQLKFALQGASRRERTLMIGDALGDLDAARANNVMFYPIIPGREKQSWELFLNEALHRFFQLTYAGDYEQRLLGEFMTVLRPDEVWLTA